jgi:hypothetical protein
MTKRWTSLFPILETSTKTNLTTWNTPPINAVSLHYPYLEKIAVVSEAISPGNPGRY